MTPDRDELLEELADLNRALRKRGGDPLYRKRRVKQMADAELADAVRTTEMHYSHLVKLQTEQEGR